MCNNEYNFPILLTIGSERIIFIFATRTKTYPRRNFSGNYRHFDIIFPSHNRQKQLDVDRRDSTAQYFNTALTSKALFAKTASLSFMVNGSTLNHMYTNTINSLLSQYILVFQTTREEYEYLA